MLGHKMNAPTKTLGQKMGSPQIALGQKGAVEKKNYLHNVEPRSVKQSPVEKLARSANALGQYA